MTSNVSLVKRSCLDSESHIQAAGLLRSIFVKLPLRSNGSRQNSNDKKVSFDSQISAAIRSTAGRLPIEARIARPAPVSRSVQRAGVIGSPQSDRRRTRRLVGDGQPDPAAFADIGVSSGNPISTYNQSQHGVQLMLSRI
jgi:hypothetical protein